MKNILELLNDMLHGKIRGQDSPFVSTARIKEDKEDVL